MTTNIEAQDKFLTVNNLRLHYLNWGGQEAQPMVLLHGMTGTCHSWDFFASAMRHDYRVWRFASSHRTFCSSGEKLSRGTPRSWQTFSI